MNSSYTHPPLCTMNSQMDAQLDLLCFDLMHFDCTHPVFPKNAAYFMIHMSEIDIPQDHIPQFGDIYKSRVSEMNDFQTVEFYADFTRLISSRPITTDVKENHKFLQHHFYR